MDQAYREADKTMRQAYEQMDKQLAEARKEMEEERKKAKAMHPKFDKEESAAKFWDEVFGDPEALGSLAYWVSDLSHNETEAWEQNVSEAAALKDQPASWVNLTLAAVNVNLAMIEDGLELGGWWNGGWHWRRHGAWSYHYHYHRGPGGYHHWGYHHDPWGYHHHVPWGYRHWHHWNALPQDSEVGTGMSSGSTLSQGSQVAEAPADQKVEELAAAGLEAAAAAAAAAATGAWHGGMWHGGNTWGHHGHHGWGHHGWGHHGWGHHGWGHHGGGHHGWGHHGWH